jgi:preprotein translocase subunit SecD
MITFTLLLTFKTKFRVVYHQSLAVTLHLEDTKDLANVLKAGRLPAPARIIGEAVVGPSLGQEAISAGLLSCILGLVVILIFMIAYYNRAGTIAVIAVLINVFFLWVCWSAYVRY